MTTQTFIYGAFIIGVVGMVTFIISHKFFEITFLAFVWYIFPGILIALVGIISLIAWSILME
jgi:hypothetical protein